MVNIVLQQCVNDLFVENKNFYIKEYKKSGIINILLEDISQRLENISSIYNQLLADVVINYLGLPLEIYSNIFEGYKDTINDQLKGILSLKYNNVFALYDIEFDNQQISYKFNDHNNILNYGEFFKIVNEYFIQDKDFNIENENDKAYAQTKLENFQEILIQAKIDLENIKSSFRDDVKKIVENINCFAELVKETENPNAELFCFKELVADCNNILLGDSY